ISALYTAVLGKILKIETWSGEPPPNTPASPPPRSATRLRGGSAGAAPGPALHHSSTPPGESGRGVRPPPGACRGSRNHRPPTPRGSPRGRPRPDRSQGAPCSRGRKPGAPPPTTNPPPPPRSHPHAPSGRRRGTTSPPADTPPPAPAPPPRSTDPRTRPNPRRGQPQPQCASSLLLQGRAPERLRQPSEHPHRRPAVVVHHPVRALEQELPHRRELCRRVRRVRQRGPPLRDLPQERPRPLELRSRLLDPVHLVHHPNRQGKRVVRDQVARVVFHESGPPSISSRPARTASNTAISRPGPT